MFAHEYSEMSKEAIFEVAMEDIPTLLNFCDETIRMMESMEKGGGISAPYIPAPRSEQMSLPPKTADDEMEM